MTTAEISRLGAEMDCSYERGIQVNMMRSALQRIAGANDIAHARRIAETALAENPKPYPVPSGGV